MDSNSLAEQVAARLIERKETIAIAESSAGGLISAALLAVPGASAYFLGGAVIYTITAREMLLGITKADMEGMRPSTEPYARLLAGRMREKFGSVWSLAETGATGPTGNRYGDAAGHACFAIDGPVKLSRTIETANADRADNMATFAAMGLGFLLQALE